MKNFPIAVLLTDTHLFEKRTRQDAIIDCNYDEVLLAFKQAIEQAKQNNLKYVFHLGDFFDSRKHQSKSLLRMAEDIFNLFLQSDIKLVIINGNHDMTDYEDCYSFVSPFKHNPNIKHIETFDFIDIENVRYHFLSFFENHLYVQYLDYVKKNISKDHKNVLLTHIGIHGALKHNGEKESSSITFEMFKEFDKVLIGHFHNYSSHVRDKIVYIGSVIQHSFGEDNKKGIMVLDNELHLNRIKTQFKEYQTTTINIEDVSPSDLQDLLAEQVDNHQRIVLTGKEDLLKSFDKSQLTNYGVKVEIKSDPIEVKEIQRRLSSHDENSILENFEIFCTENSFEVEEGLIYLK